MALSRVVSEIFNAEKYRDLDIRIRGHSRSLKVVQFDRLCMVSITLSLRDIRLAITVYREFETRVRVTQGHRNRHVSIRHLRLPNSVPW